MSARRIRALEERHAELEAALAEALARPAPNLAEVRFIKRRTLAIKDEIAALIGARRRRLDQSGS